MQCSKIFIPPLALGLGIILGNLKGYYSTTKREITKQTQENEEKENSVFPERSHGNRDILYLAGHGTGFDGEGSVAAPNSAVDLSRK